MAAPSESTILNQFLLAPAQLPCFLSLADFTALFPKTLQNSPQVRALYRDLQRQRNIVVDDTAAEIDAEVARGRLLCRHAVRARLRADAQEDTAGDDELHIEHMLNQTGAGNREQHSLVSLVAELEATVHDMEADIQRLDEEDARLRLDLQQTVGNLSDFRYGRFANTQLREQVMEGLNNVYETCSPKTAVPNTRANS